MEVGFVTKIKDYLAYLNGLPGARVGDLVESETGIIGQVNSISEDEVEVWLLNDGSLSPGEMFKKTGNLLNIPLDSSLLGRAINPLGSLLDGKTPLKKNQTLKLTDKVAPGLNQRDYIKSQLDSGISIIDTIIPIGKGQRELVIGDARSGKTDFLINIIVNQQHTSDIKNHNMICIYALIGKPINDFKNLYDALKSQKALPYTIIVATSSTDPAPLIFLTPYIAFDIATYFQSLGKDVLIVLDDMGNHAKIYREISLLSNKAPGRESYPGDVFHQQAHLLERAGLLNKQSGGGSITALPVIELNLNDFTTSIPTNLMAMTDGHLLFRSPLFAQGRNPAIDISLSVSRVGQQTQNRVQNLLSTRIKQVLAAAAGVETVSRFSFELPAQTQLTLKQRDLLLEFLNQPPLLYLSKEVQVMLLSLPFLSFMSDKDSAFVRNNLKAFIEIFNTDPDLKEIKSQVFNFKSDEELFEKLETLSAKLQGAVES